MHLLPRELDKLMLTQVGVLAQRRLARGLRLNHPEAVGLIATVMLELIRDGSSSVAQLMATGQHLLGRRQVLPGVAELIPEVQIEGTFPDGTKLVTVHHPISADDGDLALALYGSFLPVPDLARFQESPTLIPGEVQAIPGTIDLNASRATIDLTVTNLADRPIQVGSHYHFTETNAYLRFDRAAAYGMRLDIASGTAVRFEPGESKVVRLVAIAGNRVVRGGNRLAEGPVTEAVRADIPARAAARGFAHLTEAP